MGREGRQDEHQSAMETEQSEQHTGDSVAWKDIADNESYVSNLSEIAEDSETSEPLNGDASQGQTNTFRALKSATELFVGLSEPVGEHLDTYVTELPQWFRNPSTTEARIIVGDEVVETEGFCQTDARLHASASTRTGTHISLTVIDTDRDPDTEQPLWVATEQELVKAVVSILKTEVDRWVVDSLKRVSDGVVALDTDLHYTYVNKQAEQILGKARDELRGEYVWEMFPEALNTVAKERLETALETQTPTSFEQYSSESDQWIEARIYPSDDGILLFFTDTTESKISEHERAQIIEAAPAGILILTASGEITRVNARAEELLGLSKSDIKDRRYDTQDWNIWTEDGAAISPSEHPVTHVKRTEEPVRGFTHGITLPDGSDRWLSSNVTPIFDTTGSIKQFVVALEDITVLKRLEQLIKTFNPVNECLNTATTRQETERDICELLTDTQAYQYASIVDPTQGQAPADASLRRRPDTVSRDGLVLPPIASHTETKPAQVALETGEIQVVNSRQDDVCFEAWRAYTHEQGFDGGAIIPLSHGTQIYSLLVLYTNRSDAFEEREVTLLSTLADRIGQVLDALETERALHADAMVALTFRSTDSGSFFVSASKQLGCTIDIKDTVPVSEDTVVYYASVRNASLSALREVAEDTDYVSKIRHIRQTEDAVGGDIEIKLQERSLAAELIRQGAVIKSETITDGEAEIICELPLRTDICSLVTRFTEAFPNTELVAKHEYTHSESTAEETATHVLPEIYRDKLTDRQQQVLRAATYGNFFQSPRGTTASEIADTLSLTQSTVSYHLRNAQQTVFETLFEQL